jgi:FG-GAP-like repeat
MSIETFTRNVRHAFVFLALAAAPQLFAQGFSHTEYHSPNRPTDVFVADLNGDGKADVVTTQSTSNAVTVFLNHGDGTFTDFGSGHYLTGANPQRVVIADFNADGKRDIATANCNPSTHVGSISVLLGNGDGTFQTHKDLALPAGSCPNSLGIMKANTDTRPDLVVANDGTAGVRVLVNAGGGNFTLGTKIAPPAGSSGYRGVSAADYNRDGKDDIAVVEQNGSSANVVVLFANATGYTRKVINTFTGVAAAANTTEVNGDGVGDIIVPFTRATATGPNVVGVQVLMNNKNASFWTWTTKLTNEVWDFNSVGWKAAVADFTHNADALNDIILPTANLANGSSDGVMSFIGTSRSTWANDLSASGANNSQPMAAARGDFNGDGFEDVALVETGTETLGILTNDAFPNGSPSVCTADFGSATICGPTPSGAVVSPFRISADVEQGSVSPDATPATIINFTVWLDGAKVFTSSGKRVEQDFSAPVGTHTVRITADDTFGNHYDTSSMFKVVASATTTTCSAPTTSGVKVCSPANGATVTSPVNISAAANGGGRSITAMRAYVDGVLKGSSSAGSLNAQVAEAVGSHTLTVNAWNSAGTLFTSKSTFSVH